MMLIKKMMLASAVTIACGVSIESSAAQTCPTCGGYWYKAYTTTNNGGMTSYQYADRGPYASAEECQDAVSLDAANNDSWLPYYGSPICKFRFESDYDAYKEILDFWNLSTPPSHNGSGVMDNEELIRKVKILRRDFNIKAYEHELATMITDPEIDG